MLCKLVAFRILLYFSRFKQFANQVEWYKRLLERNLPKGWFFSYAANLNGHFLSILCRSQGIIHFYPFNLQQNVGLIISMNIRADLIGDNSFFNGRLMTLKVHWWRLKLKWRKIKKRQKLIRENYTKQMWVVFHHIVTPSIYVFSPLFLFIFILLWLSLIYQRWFKLI